jgi:hypothetical protein
VPLPQQQHTNRHTKKGIKVTQVVINIAEQLREEVTSQTERLQNINSQEQLDAFLENALEITVSGTGSQQDGWTVHTVDILLTYGGPSITAKVDPEASSTEVVGYWGSACSRHRGVAGDALAEWAREYAALMDSTN